jgi:hypothetical protein
VSVEVGCERATLLVKGEFADTAALLLSPWMSFIDVRIFL